MLSALTCLGAAALSGIATPYLKRATTRMEPLAITAGMHAASLLLLLLPGAVYDFPNAHFTPSALAAVTVLGIATSGLAYWLFMRIMQNVPPMASMTANFMSTGFGVLWSVLLLGEATSVAMAAGGRLTVLACWSLMSTRWIYCAARSPSIGRTLKNSLGTSVFYHPGARAGS